jgi:diphosphate-dependent phosphofructokinase
MGLFDMARKLHPESKLFGFLAGPHGVFTGNYMEITPEYMNLYRNMGGFDMIRAGRHKIETPEQFASSLEHATKMDLDGLAVIGGDDSNTNACLLAEYFAAKKSKCSVIGCPKTIDGDLRNEHIQVSFGFDTATKVYSEAIGNLCTDAVSSRSKYHFVRLMGRSASHIVLECALQTRVNCALIGEEVEAKHASLEDITMQVADVVCRRSERGKDYGVVLVPEGLIEFIPEVSVLIGEINEILAAEFTGEIEAHVLPALTESSRALFARLPRSVSSQLLLDRDPHGNVQVSKIDTERLLILMVKKELENRRKVGVYKGSFKPQSHFFGYEGRCALPSNFDSSYCYAIGMNAATLMLQKRSGYMSCVKNLGDPDPAKWVAAGCPLPAMMGIERRHGKDKPVITKALVKLGDPMFKCFETVRAKWAYLDCYQSPGPIQFTGAASDALNFMVSPPDVDAFVYATEVQEKYENRHQDDDIIQRQESSLSVLSRSRIRAAVTVPDTLGNANFRMTAIKKY